MKFQVQALLAAGLAATAQAHSIFQKISVNGVEHAQLEGFRAPSSNSPIMDVTTDDIICQVPGSTSTAVVDVPAGAKVGTYWGHVLGGEQYAGDVDNPIAASHKGPISVYVAKVDNAATTAKTGLKWVKVAHEGFNTATTTWAVDTMIAGGGWWYFTLPSCLAPGNYLLRAELIALHSAYDNLGAQFYISCVQINVTGGGSTSGSTVSFPGAYAQSDPGILINIYGSTGQPDNGGKAYAIPGPSPLTCGASSAQTTTTKTTTKATTTATTLKTTTRAATTTTKAAATTTKAATTTTKAATTKAATTKVTTTVTKTATAVGCPTSTASAASALQTLYGQCGGLNWTGPTACAQGTCKYQNDYYSQCVN